MEIILNKVAAGLSPTSAARAAGLKIHELRVLIAQYPGFEKEMQDAYDQGSDYLEDLALVRAHESDAVLLKLLEARRPEKFSNKRLVNAGVKIVINSLRSDGNGQPLPEGTPQVQIEGELVEEEQL
jgi:hypothetical protein